MGIDGIGREMMGNGGVARIVLSLVVKMADIVILRIPLKKC